MKTDNLPGYAERCRHSGDRTTDTRMMTNTAAGTYRYDAPMHAAAICIRTDKYTDKLHQKTDDISHEENIGRKYAQIGLFRQLTNY